MANELEILQSGGAIFFVKGNDVVPMGMSPALTKEVLNPESPSVKAVKRLIDDGYELAVDDGSEEAKKIRKTVADSSHMRGRPFQYLGANEGFGKKLLRGISSIGGKFKGKLPGVLGILDIMGMKKEYEQILAGEHPVLNAVMGERADANQVYKDGGIVDINYLTRGL